MKRLFYYLICFLFCCFLPFSVRAEEIRDFTTTITVEKIVSWLYLKTLRMISVLATDIGIFRIIPITKTNDQGEKFKLNNTGMSVMDDQGVPYQMQQSSTADELTVKIGDPNTTITGVHI